MKAFIEILSGVIRSGPDCDRYGKPYDYAIAFSCVDGKTAILKALVSESGELTVGHAKAAFAEIKKLGLTPQWERFT